MSENSKIEWCHHTVNPWWGCTEVHAGCDNCYARVLSNRWGKDLWGTDKPRMETKNWLKDLYKYQKKAAAAGEVHRVFIGSMMDIFERPMPVVDWSGREIDDHHNEEDGELTTGRLRNQLFKSIHAGAYHNLLFLFLTKRPSNINKYIPESWKQNPPANVMFGTSVVNQETADKLIPQLMEVNGRKFLSMEPLIGPVDLVPFLFHPALHLSPADLEPNGAIDWIIAGGESGTQARPMHPDWVRSIRDQCKEAGVPFLFKQWGEFVMIEKEFEPDSYFSKVSKSKAGRLLDGKLHDEFPKP